MCKKFKVVIKIKISIRFIYSLIQKIFMECLLRPNTCLGIPHMGLRKTDKILFLSSTVYAARRRETINSKQTHNHGDFRWWEEQIQKVM